MEARPCNKCGTPTTDFPKGRRVCKVCRRKQQKEYYRTPSGKASFKKSGSRWYEKTKDTDVRKVVVSAWRVKNRDKLNAYYRARDDGNREVVRQLTRIKLRKLRAEKPEHFHKYARQRKQSNKELVEGLKRKPCMDCGKELPSYCMDFDHVRGEKKKPISDMYVYSQATLLTEVKKCDLVCACCHRIRTQKRAKIRTWRPGRRLWFDSLKSKPCSDCGLTFPPEAMDFDHVRGEKVAGICQIYDWKEERILLELSKCDLVCACCHRIRTNSRKNQERVA